LVIHIGSVFDNVHRDKCVAPVCFSEEERVMHVILVLYTAVSGSPT